MLFRLDVMKNLTKKKLKLRRASFSCVTSDVGVQIILRDPSLKRVEGKLFCSQQPWETEISGKVTARISRLESRFRGYEKRLDVTKKLLDYFFRNCRKTDVAVVFTRVSENDIGVLHGLEDKGFRALECLLTFESSGPTKWKCKSGVRVREFQEKDLKILERIGATSFEYSRFHSDPRISRPVADRSRAAWVRNSCLGRSSIVFVAVKGKLPVGFCLCREVEDDGVRKGVIDLIAADRAFPRQGIGLALTGATVDHYAEKKMSVLVGTQGKNVPSVNLYIKAGFRLVRSDFGMVKYF